MKRKDYLVVTSHQVDKFSSLIIDSLTVPDCKNKKEAFEKVKVYYKEQGYEGTFIILNIICLDD